MFFNVFKNKYQKVTFSVISCLYIFNATCRMHVPSLDARLKGITKICTYDKIKRTLRRHEPATYDRNSPETHKLCAESTIACSMFVFIE